MAFSASCGSRLRLPIEHVGQAMPGDCDDLSNRASDDGEHADDIDPKVVLPPFGETYPGFIQPRAIQCHLRAL